MRLYCHLQHHFDWRLWLFRWKWKGCGLLSGMCGCGSWSALSGCADCSGLLRERLVWSISAVDWKQWSLSGDAVIVKWNGSELDAEVCKFVVWKWNQAVWWWEIDSEGFMVWDDVVTSARWDLRCHRVDDWGRVLVTRGEMVQVMRDGEVMKQVRDWTLKISEWVMQGKISRSTEDWSEWDNSLGVSCENA